MRLWKYRPESINENLAGAIPISVGASGGLRLRTPKSASLAFQESYDKSDGHGNNDRAINHYNSAQLFKFSF